MTLFLGGLTLYSCTGFWPNIIDTIPSPVLSWRKQEKGKQKINFCLIFGVLHDQHIQKVRKALLHKVGNHRLISLLSRKMKIKQKNITNPSKDPSFLNKFHLIPSPLEVTTIMFLRSQILLPAFLSSLRGSAAC